MIGKIWTYGGFANLCVFFFHLQKKVFSCIQEKGPANMRNKSEIIFGRQMKRSSILLRVALQRQRKILYRIRDLKKIISMLEQASLYQNF